MLDLERGWAIDCHRCAREDFSPEDLADLAHVDLRLRGWTRDPNGRQFCPECSKEKP